MRRQASTLIIACGAIAHELTAVTRANGLPHIDIQCLPAEWHNYPEKIAPAVEKKLSEARNLYRHILVAYGDCGTGGQLDAVLASYGVERLPGDHCYSFFTGRQDFAALAQEELGTFFLTDYLVDHFDRLILNGLGIAEHPELRDVYFQHYTRVVYLVQDQEPGQRQKRLELAGRAADALGLSLEIRDTGLGPFKHALHRLGVPITETRTADR